MRHFDLTPMLPVLLLVGCGGGGGSTKPDPEPTVVCSQRLGTGGFVTTTVNNPSVTDSTCPDGSTLTTAGNSYTTTTTTYSCPNPNSNTDPIAATTTSAPIVTQTKVCTVTPTLTCAQKDGQGAFVDSSVTDTVTDGSCPTGQYAVQSGLSNITTTTSYSCVDPNSSADPVASIVIGNPVPQRPKVCNLNAPINYSTYFRDKTGVTEANAAGFTGAGVKLVVIDNGFNINNAALKDRISITFGDLTDDDPDKTSHGTSVSAIAAGAAIGNYPGGAAPNAILAVSDWDAPIQPIIDWGAKVYNFSFGYDPETAGATQSQISTYVNPWLSELRAIKNSGAFIAISAGNEEKNSVQILAGAPAFYPDLDNILAVIAMSPLNGTIAGYSNRCGAVAKAFCIAAPGTVNLLLPTVNAGDTITADSYYSFDGSPGFAGTSTAAPIVSGIAALVYQAFPGMTGRQVRDTLITTATDLGELGVDDIYGVGYVNAQKAVLGPGTLRTTFAADIPDNVTWTFGNDISGEGDLIKIGGGGLISGVANYIKAVRPEIKVIGVQMNDSDAMIQSVSAKKRVTLNDVGLFSDGTAVKLVGEETFRVTRGLVDDYMTVDTDAVCAAIKDVFVDTRSIVEPAGALAVAAIKQYVAKHKTKGETYAAILCGANMNFDRLRFVAERAEVGEEREAIFAVTIPEARGSFKRFCELIGNTQVKWRIQCIVMRCKRTRCRTTRNGL